ncbi:hypothetical protein L3V83_02620 [Thiotrichales bacterium 19X7-9]|nr:hypothetical protein [Thiotrichales bacterium 19X7-9]
MTTTGNKTWHVSVAINDGENANAWKNWSWGEIWNKYSFIENVISRTGDWDFDIQLKSDITDVDVKKLVTELRTLGWVKRTNTWNAWEVSATDTVL